VARPRTLVLDFARPHLAPSLWQLLTTLVPLALCWYLSWRGLQYGYPFTLLGAAATGVFLVRAFVIQHDCGHRSFFRSPLANDLLGLLLGVLTLAPYHYWRRTHDLHHASAVNLDRRSELGYIDLLTVAEYRRLSPARRALYQVYRHPLVLLLVGVPFQFLLKHRCPWDLPRAWRRGWRSVAGTNLALLGVLAIAERSIGIAAFSKVHLPAMLVMCVLGWWLFFLQHHFEAARWQPGGSWSHEDAALAGSSFYDLPAWAHWLSGHIELHHVHHLCPRIPNYRLQECLDRTPALQRVTRISFGDSLRCFKLASSAIRSSSHPAGTERSSPICVRMESAKNNGTMWITYARSKRSNSRCARPSSAQTGVGTVTLAGTVDLTRTPSSGTIVTSAKSNRSRKAANHLTWPRSFGACSCMMPTMNELTERTSGDRRASRR
jgi:omega-6 fatty acid desaturase (delta-12 desaturase)